MKKRKLLPHQEGRDISAKTVLEDLCDMFENPQRWPLTNDQLIVQLKYVWQDARLVLSSINRKARK